jgi:hypothetical protein
MPVVMLVAAGAVLIGVIVVALGRGGELAYFQADYFPLKLEQVSATDVALFRPPMALWGYNAQATDEALNRIATALTERDIEISALQQQVADLEASSGPRTRVMPESTRGRDPRHPAGLPGDFERPADLPGDFERPAAGDEPPRGHPVTFGDDAPATRPPASPRPFAPHPPPAVRPARRPDPPFTPSARPDARSRFGLPAAGEDEDD